MLQTSKALEIYVSRIEGTSFRIMKIGVWNLNGFVVRMSSNQQDVSLPKWSAWKKKKKWEILRKKRKIEEKWKKDALPLWVKCLAKGIRGRRTLQREMIHRNRKREAVVIMKAIFKSIISSTFMVESTQWSVS